MSYNLEFLKYNCVSHCYKYAPANIAVFESRLKTYSFTAERSLFVKHIIMLMDKHFSLVHTSAPRLKSK